MIRPKLKHHVVLSLFSMLFILFVGNSVKAQSKWEKFHEDKNVRIDYQLKTCEDKVNDFSFAYYLIKVVNKKSKSLNVQYSFSNATAEENSFSFILKPNESIEGDCSSTHIYLKKFVDNIEKLKPFNLHKIKVYGL